jgi:hypothetical protein
MLAVNGFLVAFLMKGYLIPLSPHLLLSVDEFNRLLAKVREKVKGEGGAPSGDKGRGKGEESFLSPFTFPFY